jgi:hypothetical protein
MARVAKKKSEGAVGNPYLALVSTEKDCQQDAYTYCWQSWQSWQPLPDPGGIAPTTPSEDGAYHARRLPLA